MVRGLYTAASGALVAQSAVDTIANNLANVNTNGFKRTLLQVQAQPQRELYRSQIDPGKRPGGVPVNAAIGTLGSGAQVYDTPADFAQGAIKATGRDLDVALSGSGFFAIQDGTGQLNYTRDGAFQRDAQGFLSAQNGDRVLSANGLPIQIPDQGTVAIGRDGTITVNGQTRDRIGIAEFANLTALRPAGSNRFVDSGGGAGPRAATNTTALQGSVEGSNADVVRSMVDLIANERWFDANQKMIQQQDDTTGRAIAYVGRTNG